MPTTKESVLDDIDEWDKWVVAEPLGHPITINKVHALQYGTYLGIAVGLLASVWWTAAVYLSVFIVFGALGVVGVKVDVVVELAQGCPGRRRTTIAILTVYHKPHYTLAAYFVVFGVTKVAAG